FTDEQVMRIARTEPTLRDMLQQFRHLFDHVVYGSEGEDRGRVGDRTAPRAEPPSRPQAEEFDADEDALSPLPPEPSGSSAPAPFVPPPFAPPPVPPAPTGTVSRSSAPEPLPAAPPAATVVNRLPVDDLVPLGGPAALLAGEVLV